MPALSRKNVRTMLDPITMRVFFAITLLYMSANEALAATGGTAAPGSLDAAMTNVLNVMTGPTVRTLAVILVAAAGIMMAFGDRMSDGLGKLGKVGLGIGIALSAGSVMDMFGFTAAMV